MKLIDPAEMRRMSAEERIRKLRGEKASLSPIAPSLVRYLESGGKSDYETASPADVGFGLAKAALTSAKKAQMGEKGGAQSALKAFEQAGYSFTPQGVHFDPAKVKDEAVRRRQPKTATAQFLTPQAEPEKGAESAPAETYAYHLLCIIADKRGLREECEIAISAPIDAEDGMLEVTLICKQAFRTLDPRYAGDTAEEEIAHALNILRRNLRRNGRWLEDSEGKVIELPTPQAFCPSYPSDEEIDAELAMSR